MFWHVAKNIDGGQWFHHSIINVINDVVLELVSVKPLTQRVTQNKCTFRLLPTRDIIALLAVAYSTVIVVMFFQSGKLTYTFISDGSTNNKFRRTASENIY